MCAFPGKSFHSRCVDDDNDDAPVPPRKRRGPSLQDPTHRKRKGNILSSILTDIPEIDICSTSSDPLAASSQPVPKSR